MDRILMILKHWTPGGSSVPDLYVTIIFKHVYRYCEVSFSGSIRIFSLEPFYRQAYPI